MNLSQIKLIITWTLSIKVERSKLCHPSKSHWTASRTKKKEGRTDQSLPKSPSKEGAACFCFLFGMSYYCNLNNWTNERPTNRTMNRTSRHKKSVIGDDGGKKSHNKQLWAKRHHSYRFYKPHVNSFPLSLPLSCKTNLFFFLFEVIASFLLLLQS